MIERYTDQYEADVHRLIKEFQDESLEEYGVSFNDRALSDQLAMHQNQTYLLIMDGKAQGILAGKEVRSPISTDRVWHEMVWFVSKKSRRYGLKLLSAVKQVLKAQGFKTIVMVYMHNSKSDKLHRLYTRLGYKAMETNFIGRL